MAKQWLYVLVAVAGIGLGAWALVRFGPRVERVEVGRRAPDVRAVDLKTGATVSLRQHYKGQVVLEQHPGAGTLSPKDARVDLVVSQSN